MLKRIMQMLVLAVMPNGLLLAQATQPAPAQTDVPVKTVVLFSSGVGYFEHGGSVKGDGSTELRFKTSQINDILKSLVLQDLDGGKVGTVTYPSQDPISKTLRSFQVDITNNPSMADLLNQLRGAKVTIQAQAEKVTGTVLGVERKQKQVGDKGNPIDVPVLNLLTGATIRSIELDSVNNLVLEDAQLQQELTKALLALTQARDQDKKPVTINFTGNGERRVKIGYVVETPIWKTSYRLIMDDKGGKLQGWAIVENQTESDWNNVQLSLVSGRPISFVMDLYRPLYVARPTVVQEMYASLRPQVYDEGMLSDRERLAMSAPAPALQQQAAAAGRGRGGGGGGAFGGGGGGRGGAPAAAPVAGDMAGNFGAVNSTVSKTAAEPMDVTASIQSIASATKMGELFQYAVPNVSLARQKSAMLPIITDSIEVERLSIYNASVLQKNPLNGARLKNTTDKHLLQGPITVIDANSYAGDAQIDSVPPGQERMISYGIDLGMNIDNTKNTQANAIMTGKVEKGMLVITRKNTFSQDYLADNKGDKEKTLIIEHPIRQGWKLVDTQKPLETTQSLYRFKLAVPVKKVGTFTVKEEIVRDERMAMLPADIPALVFYAETGEIPKNVRDALNKAIQLKQAVIDTERLISQRTQDVSDITQEQNRIRENMKTVDQKTQYYERLLTKLNEQESQIEKLQTERDDLMKKRDSQRAAMEDYVNTLTIG